MTVQIISTLQGVQRGLFSVEVKREEKDCFKAKSLYSAAFWQTFQNSLALGNVNRALYAGGLSPCHKALGRATWFIPFYLATLQKQNLIPECLKPAAQLVQRHMSTVAQVANVVSCIALIAFGQYFFAVASLVCLGLEAFYPSALQSVLVTRYIQPIAFVAGVVTGGFVDRLLCLCLAAIYAANWSRSRIQKEEMPNQKLDEKSVEQFLNRPIETIQINQKHIHYFVSDKDSLRYKVLTLLRQKRKEWVEREAKKMIDKFREGRDDTQLAAIFFDVLNTYYRHRFIDACEDQLSLVDGETSINLTKAIFRWTIGPFIEKDFWKEDQVEQVLSHFEESVDEDLDQKIKAEFGDRATRIQVMLHTFGILR